MKKIDKDKRRLIKDIIRNHSNMNIQQIVMIARGQDLDISYKDILDLIEDGAIGLRSN